MLKTSSLQDAVSVRRPNNRTWDLTYYFLAIEEWEGHRSDGLGDRGTEPENSDSEISPLTEACQEDNYDL
jgi:hypothetical protein